jgi:hypothetical protein
MLAIRGSLHPVRSGSAKAHFGHSLRSQDRECVSQIFKLMDGVLKMGRP